MEDFRGSLQCSACTARYQIDRLHNVCSGCGAPLLVQYDFDRSRSSDLRNEIRAGVPNMWRYAPV
ncbi:MAG: hypothetical protein ABI718_15650, partial [Acidobacteriota bacterium]